MTEAAWIAGVSRQAVAKWCKAAGLHMKGMRHEWLLKLRFDGERVIERSAAPMNGGKRLSKAELRARGAQAKADWDHRHGTN